MPAELRAEITRASSLAEHAWVEAKERSDFASFLPHLERNVELKRRYADVLRGVRGLRANLRPAAGRLRARDEDRGGGRGAGGPSRRDPAAGEPSSLTAPGRSTTPAFTAVSRSTPQARLAARGGGGAAPRAGRVAPRPDGASVRDRDRPLRHPDHDAVRRALRRHRALGRRSTRPATACTRTGSLPSSSARRLRARPRWASTSRRAACGRTGWGAAVLSWSWLHPRLRRDLPGAVRRRGRRDALPGGEQGRAPR